MSTSKGLGLKARDAKDLLPPSIIRFLFGRTDYKQAVEFDPVGTMAIPDLFDEYDRCYKAYIEGSDEDLTRIFEMSQIGDLPKKESTFLPRFRDVVNYLQQPGVDLTKKFEELKGDSLNEVEENILREREKYGKIWLEKYAPENLNFQMSSSLSSSVELDEEQKSFLSDVINLIEKGLEAEELQKELYNLSKEKGIPTKKAFTAIYQVFLGKEHGPKAGALLVSLPKEEVIKRLKESVKK